MYEQTVVNMMHMLKQFYKKTHTHMHTNTRINTHKHFVRLSQASKGEWNIKGMWCESGPPQYLIKIHFKSNPNV